MNNKILSIVAVVLIGASFYGGLIYGKSTTKNSSASKNIAGNTQQPGQKEGIRNEPAPNVANISGRVVSSTPNSLTVMTKDNTAKLVTFGENTAVRAFVDAKSEDLDLGQLVVVNGVTNADGSVNAMSIQIRAVSPVIPTPTVQAPTQP